MTADGTSPTANQLAAVMPRPKVVNEVLKLVFSGATQHDVEEAIQKTFPGEEAKPLILEVMKGLEQAAGFNPTVVLGWCFEASRDLYRRMSRLAISQARCER